MVSISFIYSFFIYFTFELFVRHKSFKYVCCKRKLTLWKFKTMKEPWVIMSPGYLFSRYYKNKIDGLEKSIRSKILKRYLKILNKINLYISVIVSSFFLASFSFLESHIYLLLSGFITFRFISRVLEIIFSFTNDVLSKTNKSNLTKHDRIKLAAYSYIELFFIMAPVYIINGTASNSLVAISMSLSVGTLTNIGLVVTNNSPVYANIAFVQVFATMSLVIFSLAMYLSREK